MASKNPTVAVSAPGKVLLAGGYLVLDRRHTGLVFGLSARINVVAGEIHTSQGVQLNEIMVDSPQFLDAQWRYGYHLAPEGGGIQVTQLQVPARLIILADNDYYSQSTPRSGEPGRFARFTVPLGGANKTGLGSSAALVTALTAALLSHYLPWRLLDITSAPGKRRLHNLAQAAHCAAQGKVGSGFDVAAAVYGSCLYRRFSPGVLGQLPEAGSPGFAEKLVSVVDGVAWDVEVLTDGLRVPEGVALRMCDVDCGSRTVGMVKKVLAWRGRDVDVSTRLWDELQARNEDLAAKLRDGNVADIPTAVGKVRELIREMGKLSDVPIEPESQTELLDVLSALEGVYGGVVPGAGGFDALALLMKDDEETKRRVEERVAEWSREKGSKVRLLDVKGEMEGVRCENLDVYSGWIEIHDKD
ncbi:phosphomevalonate kinase [Metarhizium acridum CQMa 102]|uniref:phosphomevalonate kinase n=1 Tax=Metarhizium acridum (strain CQMa 102) TaxID=655827 RepID=E9DSS5_METAQ|nr:phosphomevalonate kinase [Metarhizium acridum CQMa 102]EFY93435.1 phosphomevalonate kinase [Metarhizium acridum CQMa 102]